MTVIKAVTPSGAAVEIIDSGWADCVEAELDRRRSVFIETAAELYGNQQLNGRTAGTDAPT